MNSSYLHNNVASNEGFKKLYVKYMVTTRCKDHVIKELEKLDLSYAISIHGAIEFQGTLTPGKEKELREKLLEFDLLLLDENNSNLIDSIITSIVEVVHYSEELPRLKFIDIINSYLSSVNGSLLQIFSDVKGMSVMQFIIMQKIDRIKDMLLYNELTLSEISERLCYGNQDLMVAQFKKHTGLTPSYFKKLKEDRSSISAEISEKYLDEYLV